MAQGFHPAGLSKVENAELREFIEVCIQHDPNLRPEARQLLKHPFFESIRTKLSCGGTDKLAAERQLAEEAAALGCGTPAGNATPAGDVTPAGHATPDAHSDEEGGAGARASAGAASTSGGGSAAAPAAEAGAQAALAHPVLSSLDIPEHSESPLLPASRVPSMARPPSSSGAGAGAPAPELQRSASMAMREAMLSNAPSQRALRSPILQELHTWALQDQLAAQQAAAGAVPALRSSLSGAGAGGGGSTPNLLAGGHAEAPTPSLQASASASRADLASQTSEAAGRADGAAEAEALEVWEREINLHCKQVEESKLSFQLRFTEPAGERSGRGTRGQPCALLARPAAGPCRAAGTPPP